MITVYYFDEVDKLDEKFMLKADTIIPNERKTKADKYKKTMNKYLLIMSYILLLYGLDREGRKS